MHVSDHIADLAREHAGNFLTWPSFALSSDALPEGADPRQWAIVYTSNRDSGIMDRANAAVFDRTLEPHLEGDGARRFSASHWAVGHVDGYLLRVYGADGVPTAAFAAWAELKIALADYPILDESLHSEIEAEDAAQTWRQCYGESERIEHLRDHWCDYRPNFSSLADLLSCVRGDFAPWGNCGFDHLHLSY